MSSQTNSVEKAAILMMSLGEQHAAQILKHMAPKEVQRIGTAMARLENINRDQVTKVLEGFLNDAQDETGLTTDADKYIRNMLSKALGPEKADGVIERILMGGDTKGLDTLKWMEPRAVADIIRFEHPQVQAIVLSYLDGDQAAGVLALLDEKERLEVVIRISKLEAVQPTALAELNEIIEKQVSSGKTTKTTTMGGIKTAANILNAIEGSIEAAIFEEMSGIDEELVGEIQEQMFIFDNLVDLDDRSIRRCCAKSPLMS